MHSLGSLFLKKMLFLQMNEICSLTFEDTKIFIEGK